MDDVRRFWVDHYAEVLADGNTWLDYSNERVQLQTFGLCLEASDGVLDRRCLDVGTGHGQLARTLSLLGGKVVAVDLMDVLIARHRESFPEVDWRAGNVLDPAFADSLPVSDRVFALEVLQCIPWETGLEWLWTKVAPGGRLVAMLPHGGCPIVQRTKERYPGVFFAPAVEELSAALGRLPGASWSLRTLTFGQDQRLHPYEVSAWTQTPVWTTPPNRLQVVIARGGMESP